MKNCKKFLVLLLCMLLTVCPVLAACGQTEATESGSNAGTQSGTTSTPGDENDPYKDENGLYTYKNVLPAFNFTETEFRVCVYNNQVQATYCSEEIGYDLYSTTDTAINEAVKRRNDLVSEELGVKVVAVAVDDVATMMRQENMAPSDAFDAAMPFMNAAVSMAQEGMLHDLNEFSNYIHLEAPWWDQSANKSLSVAGKLYFTTGDISFMQKVVSMAILFNKNMYRDSGMMTQYGDLYQLVRDHKWTIDTMYEMGKAVTAESDGESGMSINDTWGMVGTDGVTNYYLGSGNRFITKNQADEPLLEFGTERSIQFSQHLLEVFQDNAWYYNTSGTSVPNIWEAALGAFGEGHALFYQAAFSAVKKMRNLELANNFGIVPVPLSDETQETYCTPCNLRLAYAVTIPQCVKNPEFSAYMLEVLASYAKNTITPAYYETTLKSRDAKDQESEDMLDDYVFNNVVYDIGLLYNFGNVGSMLDGLMSKKSKDVSSELDSIKGKIESDIQKCVEDFNLND